MGIVTSQFITKVSTPTHTETEMAIVELLKELLFSKDFFQFPMHIIIDQEVEGRLPSNTRYIAQILGVE